MCIAGITRAIELSFNKCFMVWLRVSDCNTEVFLKFFNKKLRGNKSNGY